MEAKTNESSAAEAVSTGQLLRRYRKLAGLTAQELAHEVNSKHPDDAITAAVVFNRKPLERAISCIFHTVQWIGGL